MTKISKLPSMATLTNDDLFVVVDDPFGFPSTKRIAAQNVLEFFEENMSNPGLVVGEDVQAHSSTLDAVAGGTYVGATSITTLGTVSTGTWQGSPIAISHGGTGATNTADLAASLGFGSLAAQDQDNVTITGGTISIDGLFNVGLSLSSESFSTAKMSARSPVSNFKTEGGVGIFTVPDGFMFVIDTMEIITISISEAGVAPKVRFGTSSDGAIFYGPTRTTSNGVGSRHVIDNPQDAVDSGSTVTFGIEEASTAVAHTGVAVVTGYLLKKT
jgi:hypothetical protein